MGTSINFRKSISNPNAMDVGNIEIQDRTASKTIQLALFTTNENAVWAAKQQLMKESYPFALVSIPVNRDLFRLQVGDCFKFSYAPYGISNMILRVLVIEEQSLESEIITVHAVEDFYSITNTITEYTTPGLLPGDDISYDLEILINKEIIEAPYLITSDTEIIPIAERRSAVDLGMNVHLSIDDGNSYSLVGSVGNLVPYGILIGDYTSDTYTIDNTIGFTIDFSNDDVNLIETITWPEVLAATNNNALLGDELITFQTITPIIGSQYKIEVIIRGRLDTTIDAHVAGEKFYFIGSLNISTIAHSEIIVNTDRKFKLVPYNIKATGDLSEAGEIELSIEGRSKKPYIPINLLANDGEYAARYTGDIVLTWSQRYRGVGAGIGAPGEVLPETDREGFFRIEVWVSSTKKRDVTDIDAVTWTYTSAMNTSDNGSLASSITFKLFNFRVEGGTTYESDAAEVVCKKEL